MSVAQPARPLVLRSMLFLPANSDRKIAKAFSSDADAVILDLEDALAISEKAAGRDNLVGFLKNSPMKPTFVRVNDIATEHCYRDILAVVTPNLTGIVLPKVEAPHHLLTIDWLVSQLEDERELPRNGIEIMPIIETAKGLAAVNDIADASARVRRLAFGMVDLAADMRLDLHDDFGAVTHARFAVAVASRAADLQGPIDTAFVDIQNLDRLRSSTHQARSMGYAGKCCIHPAQIAVVNEVFSPTAADLERAERIVAAFNAAESAGSAAVTLDGMMIDYPVVTWAQQVLSLSEALDQRRK